MSLENSMAQIEKLKGRENYATWKFAVQAYLEHEELWDCITGKDNDEKKITKARSKIILLIEPINFVHVLSAKTANEVWKNLEKAFDDSGLTRRVSLLRILITTKLDECCSMEDYVNRIITTAHSLSNIGMEVNEEWVGTILLAGLPELYNPMIMGLESSGVKITGDSIKTKLLQDVKDVKSNDEKEVSFYGGSNKKVSQPSTTQHNYSKFSKGSKCYNCGRFGHIAKFCRFNKNDVESRADMSVVDKENPSSLCTTFSVNQISNENWYIDSGASTHMCMRQDWLQNLRASTVTKVQTANSTMLPVDSVGDVLVPLKVDGKQDDVEVKDVLFVPGLCTNLLSVSQMVKKGKTVIFDSKGCKIYDANKKLVASASLVNDTFKLDTKEFRAQNGNKRPEVTFVANTKDKLDLWHRRLGHINPVYLNRMKKGDVYGLEGIGHVEDRFCTTCLKGKQTRLPFKESETQYSNLLELVHSDLCGPMEVTSFAGSKYFLTFLDDCSKKVFVYFLKSKDLVKEKFKEFKHLVENQTGRRIKTLRTDNGGEYCNKEMIEYLKESGIKHETTIPYTPEQNGKAERMNRTLVEKARCLLSDSGLEKKFWAEAINTAAFLVNRSSCSGLEGMTPVEAWSGKKPNLSFLRLFGCQAMVHVPKHKRKKFDFKSEECILIGYCENSKGYRLYNPVTKEFKVSRDVRFFEDRKSSQSEREIGDFFPTKEKPLLDEEKRFVEIELKENSETIKNPVQLGQNILEEQVVEEENVQNELTCEPRRSKRERKQVNFDDFVTYHVKTSNLSDPTTVREALSGSEASAWKHAMEEEFSSLIHNQTWELTDLPVGKIPIDCKWVFKTKKGSDGKILRHKARLVIKGYAQRKGIDYEETYSPVVRYDTVRYLLSLAVKEDLDIDQMDAVTAFLQGNLEEEIYMLQPEGFKTSNKVCRLKKSLYGLKQASRIWNQHLDLSLKNFGLQQSSYDQCVYHLISGESILIVAIYVDDLLIFSNNKKLKTNLKETLMKAFEMKDMGEARFVLGMQITRDRQKGKLWIDQELYVKDMLSRYNMEECNPVKTPLDPNQKLTKEMCPKTEQEVDEMKNVPYQQAVGSLLFAAQVTRPDISFAVSEVSRFNQNPGKAHWMAVKHILRYLKGTNLAKLQYTKDGNGDVIGFSDADWASHEDDRRSTTGYVFLNGNGAITWNSKRQKTVALSTTEAEYMAVSCAAQEAIWIRGLSDELMRNYQEEPTILYSDNKSAISLAMNSSHHSRSKHIDVKYHFIREKVKEKRIKLQYLNTKEMSADFMTKSLSPTKHKW